MALTEILQKGVAPGLVANDLLRSIEKTKLLFDREVSSYLIELHMDILRLDAANAMNHRYQP